jgi:UPF0176 protein
MVVNLAFYKFVPIDDPARLASELQPFCDPLELRGTILLAGEGINGTVAGSPADTEALVAHLRADRRFADIDFKPSESPEVPFRRMHVKVRREIVTMGVPGIAPAVSTGRYVEPTELKAWLDAGEEVLLVDTRNDYEVRLGTFRGAVNPDLKEFRSFPQWAERTLAERKSSRIVTFCTGGIRCEKATAYMREKGFDDVWQLHGGILKYFEEVARPAAARGEDAHYDGSCFVFDYRVAVDQALQPTGHGVCYACRAPLSDADRASPSYEPGRQCPYCVGKTQAKEREAEALRARTNHDALLRRRERSQRVKAERLRRLSLGRSPLDQKDTGSSTP